MKAPSVAMYQLVRQARIGRLATAGPDCLPHVVPVCFALIGDTVYSAVDEKPKRTAHLRRVANIAATGRASLLVDEYHEDWSRLWWIRVDGVGRLVSDSAEVERAIAGLVEKYPQYAQRPPRGPVVAIDVARWVSWSASGDIATAL